ncbi:MAG: NYN domain-containing protein [bacterium]|nr:NYN domain-containing protein [bacterium]
MSKQERIAVLIDGSNFYYKLKSLEVKNKRKFDFRGLTAWLARERSVISQRYYVGVIRAKEGDERGQQLRKRQQQLFSHLTSPSQHFEVRRGYLMEHDGDYHEKGVDVQLAVDLLVDAYEGTCDTFIIVSSDTDLIPAIRKVRALGKNVEYIGFAHQPSLGLQKYVTTSRLLIKEEIVPFEDQPSE